MKNKLTLIYTLFFILFSNNIFAESSCLLDYEVVLKHTLNDPDIRGVIESFDNIISLDHCKMTARLRASEMIKEFESLNTGIESKNVLGIVVNYEFINEVLIDGELVETMDNDSLEVLKPKKAKHYFKKSILPLSALK